MEWGMLKGRGIEGMKNVRGHMRMGWWEIAHEFSNESSMDWNEL